MEGITLIKKIEITSDELIILSLKRIDADFDEIDNRERLLDCIINHGAKCNDSVEFREQLAGAIINYIGMDEFVHSMKQYQKDYMDDLN